MAVLDAYHLIELRVPAYFFEGVSLGAVGVPHTITITYCCHCCCTVDFFLIAKESTTYDAAIYYSCCTGTQVGARSCKLDRSTGSSGNLVWLSICETRYILVSTSSGKTQHGTVRTDCCTVAFHALPHRSHGWKGWRRGGGRRGAPPTEPQQRAATPTQTTQQPQKQQQR